MADFKVKKLYYRRATWENQNAGPATLQSLLEAAHKNRDTVGKRTFPGSNKTEIRGANFKHKNGLLLQVASYSPGEPTSIIEKDKARQSSAITAHAAPQNNDYLHGEVFAYVKNNHVVLCPSGARESLFTAYVSSILNAENMVDIVRTLDLTKVANTSKAKMIQTEGVKEIRLGVSLYEASVHHLQNENKSKITSLLKKLAKDVEAMFAEDPDLKEIKEKENLSLNLSLKFDGRAAQRNKKDIDFGVAGKQRLQKTAQKVVSEDEEIDDSGFAIITNDGNTISSEEIRVARSFKIATLGKSLSRESAWDTLESYYGELEKNGTLSQ